MSVLIGFFAVLLGFLIIVLIRIQDRQRYVEPPTMPVRVFEEVDSRLDKETEELKQKEIQRQKDFIEVMNYNVEKAYQKKVKNYYE